MNLSAIKEEVLYNPQSGMFLWKRSGSGRKTGRSVGCLEKDGYVSICIHGNRMKAHRLAWLIYYGRLPSKQIDHINRNKSDNRIINLREVDSIENAKNQNLPKNSSSGVKGVSYKKKQGKWYASINDNGNAIHLGSFKEKEDAIRARKEAEEKLGYRPQELIWTY